MSMHSHAPMPPQRKSQTRASVGLERSKHEENTKGFGKQCTPIHHLDKVDLPSFRELLAEENRSKDLGIGSNVAEKTLYVDTEDNAKTEEVKTHGILSEKRDQNKVLDTSLLNTKKLNLKENEAKSEPQFRIPDFHIASSRGETNQQTRIAMQESSGREQEVFKDSWLGRMLPSISTKNSSVHSYRGAWISLNDKASKPKSSDPKWETMVRMTKMQDKHLCFSEDCLLSHPYIF
ncbi:hypothetical protein Leryth_024836 [Lithospermum erythrorhizon]|nr:hypothetical protein Leryth_024836 [Lithospermum erythrorhizon]